MTKIIRHERWTRNECLDQIDSGLVSQVGPRRPRPEETFARSHSARRLPWSSDTITVDVKFEPRIRLGKDEKRKGELGRAIVASNDHDDG